MEGSSPERHDIFARHESGVQSYARCFPALFARASGSFLYDEAGNAYIDFLAGAGSLNYGHNEPRLRARLIDYLAGDGIAHSLDLHTPAKAAFLAAFHDRILAPRGLDHVVQFTGPTGANAVEAALKLARKVTGRRNVIAFTNAFHGVSLGALAMTSNGRHRAVAGGDLAGVSRMPYDGYLGPQFDTLDVMEAMLADPGSGIDPAAAVIVETVQGEGGVNVAGAAWLQRLEKLCRAHGMLLIVDDIQVGCGRTGTFFSFEPAGIVPDIVTLSKSLSGYGLPLAVVAIRRAHDRWRPGEHNGTFRGNNHAFVTATAALELYWSDGSFAAEVMRKAALLRAGLDAIVRSHGDGTLAIRGRGLIQGLVCPNGAFAGAVSRAAFRRGLIAETCGPHDEVVKCLPPLTTPDDVLERALAILADSVDEVAAEHRRGA